MKALILYPMNALANDQAQRLAELLTDAPGARRRHRRRSTPASRARSAPTVTADGLITDRDVMRSSAARHPAHQLQDARPAAAARAPTQTIWAAERRRACSTSCSTSSTPTTAPRAPTSRCCCAASAWRSRATGPTTTPLTDEDRARPLGRVTPVATSATLGDKGDPAAMLEFAEHRLRRGRSTPTRGHRVATRRVEEWVGDAADAVDRADSTARAARPGRGRSLGRRRRSGRRDRRARCSPTPCWRRRSTAASTRLSPTPTDLLATCRRRTR